MSIEPIATYEKNHLLMKQVLEILSRRVSTAAIIESIHEAITAMDELNGLEKWIEKWEDNWEVWHK